jgi:hypothetical protein
MWPLLIVDVRPENWPLHVNRLVVVSSVAVNVPLPVGFPFSGPGSPAGVIVAEKFTIFDEIVSVVVPVFPLLVAVIVAFPGATPVTRPVGDTVAIASLLDVQATAAPLMAFPLASLVVALS